MVAGHPTTFPLLPSSDTFVSSRLRIQSRCINTMDPLAPRWENTSLVKFFSKISNHVLRLQNLVQAIRQDYWSYCFIVLNVTTALECNVFWTKLSTLLLFLVFIAIFLSVKRSLRFGSFVLFACRSWQWVKYTLKTVGYVTSLTTVICYLLFNSLLMMLHFLTYLHTVEGIKLIFNSSFIILKTIT